MIDLVRCRAEHAYPGRPLQAFFEKHWRTVITVLDERLTPADKRYRVICEDRIELVLAYDPLSDSWQVTAAG